MHRELRGLNAPIRSYPEALADQLARCRPGEAKLALLNRLFIEMSPADQLRTRAELHAIRAARRGEIEAVLA